MPKFGELNEYFDPGLTLTVKGKEYVLPLPSAELGLWSRRTAQLAGEIHAASTEEEIQAAVDRVNAMPQLPGDLTLHERVLGPVHAQMMADGVEDPYIQFCGATGYVWIIGGEEAAERYWTSGGRPEAWGPVPNRADRRANTQKTSTAEATGARSPASTTGTSSPKRSGSSGPVKRSRGTRS